MIRKIPVNGYVTIVQEGDLVTWEISRKRNSAMIDKIKRDSGFSGTARSAGLQLITFSEHIIFCLEYGMDEFWSQAIFCKVTANSWD